MVFGNTKRLLTCSVIAALTNLGVMGVAEATTTTTATPSVASGGNCTNPSFSTSDPQGAENIDPNDGSEYWWVDNDAWSSGHGPQTVDVCNQSSWYAVSDQPDVGGQVETYPDTEYDIGGRPASAASPATDPTIAEDSGGSITSSFSEDYPSAGGWDAAYDLWTDDWKNETMIWNQWAGSSDYWPEKATIAVTLGGVGYTFYPNCSGPADAANEAHCEYMFFRDTQVTSGSVNILAAWLWEVANGYASASDVPTQLEYGVEVSYTSGTETFPMTGLTFNVTAADGVGFSSAAQPATSTPEAPSMVLLPLAALGVFGGAYGYRRRASKRRATDQGDPSQA